VILPANALKAGQKRLQTAQTTGTGRKITRVSIDVRKAGRVSSEETSISLTGRSMPQAEHHRRHHELYIQEHVLAMKAEKQ
jgi:hypothetical protein